MVRHTIRRRTMLSTIGAVSIGGIAGCTGSPGQTNGDGESEFLQAARDLGIGDNWKARRIDTADNWPVSKRKDVPDRENDDTFRGTETLSSAPWEPPEGWEDTPAGEVDKIQMLNHGAVNMAFDPATLSTHELFEDKTGIEIEPLEIGSAQADLKTQQFLNAKKKEPHAMTTDGALTPVLVQPGHLEVVDPLYPSEDTWDPYIPALRSLTEWNTDTTREGTHVYGFPNICEATVGNLRVDLVEEQGIDSSRFEGEWTWDLLEETMAAFEGTDAFGYAFYAGNPTYLFYSFRGLLYQQGGQLVADNGKVQVDTQAARNVLKKMNEWREKRWVPGDVISFAEGDLVDIFLAGKVAFLDTFSDFVPRSLNQFTPGEQYTVVVPPAANMGPNPQQASLVDPNCTTINTYADTPEKLVALMYGDLRLSYPSQWWEFTYEGNMSYMDRVYDDAEEAGFGQFSGEMGAAIARGQLELFPQMQAIFNRLTDPFQKAITGELTPKEATQQGQEFIDSVLSQ